MLAEVSWRDSNKANSVSELDAILDTLNREISSDLPQVVQIARKNGDLLTIILGVRTQTVLSYISKSGMPPYYASLGNVNAEGVFTFYVYPDHHSESAAWSIIDYESAREAIRRFVSMEAGLPDNIKWREV